MMSLTTRYKGVRSSFRLVVQFSCTLTHSRPAMLHAPQMVNIQFANGTTSNLTTVAYTKVNAYTST